MARSTGNDHIEEAGAPIAVTASMLYDYVMCPHRVTMNLNGDHSKRDPASPFVRMLWERGTLYEREVIASLAVSFLDLSPCAGDEKERLTLEAMERGEPLIYCGRVREGDLLGEPDLLRREDGGYVAGDIKSGAGEEGPENGPSPKRHYAVQLALYTDILERMSLSSGRRAFILDIHGSEVPYDFTTFYGVRNSLTLWSEYENCIAEVRALIADSQRTRAAYSSVCKLCQWYSVCTEQLVASDDLTQIPELGRPRRDAMLGRVQTVREFAGRDAADFVAGNRTVFPGIGPDMLYRFHTRARLLSTKDAQPILYAPVKLPNDDRELFFDIEVDPMRDLCYLHGFIERRNRDNSTERFVAFFADACTEDSERDAFAAALCFLRATKPCAVYYYSKYERTLYRNLREKYPDVATEAEIEAVFDPAHAVDLYNGVVRRYTDWPTWDFSLKTLAKYLGFAWRDTDPSGAASIEWFDRWTKTGDLAVRERILDYNEDDCRATRVLLDGIRKLTVL